MSEAMLYDWPADAKFGRPVPKTKFYEHARVAGKLREHFVAEVERIVWAYKLADETIHLHGTRAVPEIQVFQIAAKGENVSDDVLSAIDSSIKFPLFFEIYSGSEPRRTRMAAAYKLLETSRPKLSSYFTSGWMPADAARRPLPPAIDLPSLYASLLAPLLTEPPRRGEHMEETTARIAEANRLRREISALKRKQTTEPQFNRKVELHRQIRDKNVELATLTDTRTED